LYPFGYGLSYTTFEYKNLKVSGGKTVKATFTVTNTGPRAGADVPQVYLTGVGDTKRMRLLGFERVELQPGESRDVTVSADPRLLARFDDKAGKWRIDGGTYTVALSRSAESPVLSAETRLQARLFGS
jgi:beta-glucosidase